MKELCIEGRASRRCLWVGVLWMLLAGGVCGQAQLRVLTYNIHHAEGTDGVVDYSRLADMIQSLRPDVVALQEVDKSTGRSRGVDQAARLAELTNLNVVFGASMPYNGGHYGQAILSRYPIDEVATYPLPFAFGLEPRSLLKVRVTPGKGLPRFLFMSTHLSHQNEATREDQVREIGSRIGQFGDEVMILAGDFNARPGSSSIELLQASESEWSDATAPESVIDYVFVRSDDPWRVVERTTVDDRVISDHRPVLVELEWGADEDRVRRATPASLEDLVALEESLQTGIDAAKDAIVAVDGGIGGGVVVSPDGYVLTAAHVSGFGRSVRIRLADGSEHAAKSLGAYRFADAAMVKIEGEGPFPYVSLAKLGATRVGDWCFALGHPGGLDEGRGVVARVGRVIYQTENLLRSDCRIIGGDSGCALFNPAGELIGIHSRIGMPLDQNYHAPIDAFLKNWEAMKAGDVLPPQVMRGRGGLGIRTSDANPGVRVVGVSREDSPLREGDVIRGFDDFSIEDDWEYLVALSSKRIDDEARLRVLRDGQWLEISVKIERRRRRN